MSDTTEQKEKEFDYSTETLKIFSLFRSPNTTYISWAFIDLNKKSIYILSSKLSLEIEFPDLIKLYNTLLEYNFWKKDFWVTSFYLTENELEKIKKVYN